MEMGEQPVIVNTASLASDKPSYDDQRISLFHKAIANEQINISLSAATVARSDCFVLRCPRRSRQC